jgi:hypothetical protein
VKTNNEPNTKRVEPTASAVLDDGAIVEMTFHPDLRATCFAICAAGRWTLQNMIDNGPDANLFRREVKCDLGLGAILTAPERRRGGSQGGLTPGAPPSAA